LSVECWVVVSGTKTKIIPASITPVDDHNVKITFTKAYSGEARVEHQKRWSDN